MHLILPIAGQSTRFPNMRPKWMLTHPSGLMMIAESIRGLNLQDFESITLGILKQHIDEYACLDGVKTQFASLGLADKLRFVIIDKPTASQPETIAHIVRSAALTGPILCKDADNYFAANFAPGNTVALYRLQNATHINPSNKSYAVLDQTGEIKNIVEKRIISDSFCVGGYGFSSAEQFLHYFDALKDQPNLYLSDIIFKMLLDNIPFTGTMAEHYNDWGTLEDWNRFKRRYATLFVDLDGTLVENGGEYMPPFWGETKAIAANVATLNKHYDSGTVEVIITTARSEVWSDATLAQLAREGIKYHRILFGLLHASRILINDFAPSNPYPTATAINLQRNSESLKYYMTTGN